jgi:hypothetical protein
MKLFTQITTLTTKSAMQRKTISFPPEEITDLSARIDKGLHIGTTRIMDEKGKYSKGEILDSEFGPLKVVSVVSGQGVDNHPHAKELTEAWKNEIGNEPWDYVELFPVDSDEAYASAVNRGDMNAAAKMVASAARARGYSIGPVHHGSPDIRWVSTDPVFKSQKERYKLGKEIGVHWFAESYGTAKTYADDRRAFNYQEAEAGIVTAYLKLDNPLEVDGKGAQWRDAQKRGKTATVIDEALSSGKDGVIIRNVQDDYQTGSLGKSVPTTTYAVFSSSRIKSSDPVTYDNKRMIPLSDRFDSSNPNIRY